MLHVSYKPASTDWLGSFALPDAGEDMAWHRFVPRATERQLTVLGFPAPGASLLDGPDVGRGRRPLPPAGPVPVASRTPRIDGATGVIPGADPWWKGGVLYQIYPRSFADSDADGVGDLRGIIDHLDHLAWLGVDGIWLSPVTVSPNADWGYDVADYCAIPPEFGTWRTSTDWWPGPRSAPSGCSWTSCPTTRATSTPGSSSRGRHARRRTGTGTSGPTARRAGAAEQLGQ